jgi:hypothetical protein
MARGDVSGGGQVVTFLTEPRGIPIPLDEPMATSAPPTDATPGSQSGICPAGPVILTARYLERRSARLPDGGHQRGACRGRGVARLQDS